MPGTLTQARVRVNKNFYAYINFPACQKQKRQSLCAALTSHRHIGSKSSLYPLEETAEKSFLYQLFIKGCKKGSCLELL